jgi:lipopolysaccharide transport system ATP-binding protein
VRSKFDAIVDFAGIERYIDTPVKRYSSGMYVRLAFAVAAFLEPEILIVDEVLAVGDAEFQKKAIGKMQDVSQNQGRTVLFVSHNLTAVKNLCQKGMVLKDGSVIFLGDVDESISTYLSQNIDKELPSNVFSVEKNGFKVSLKIKDSGRNDNLSFSGNPIKIMLEIFSPMELRNADLGLGVNDKFGTRIITYHSRFELKEKIYLKKDTNTSVTIKEDFNKLCPGSYQLYLTIFENNQQIVSWPFLGVLKVEENDVYKTGKLPQTQYQGQVLSNAKWIIS